MKKLFSIALFAAMVFGCGTTFAQCNIVTPNTNQGFTPAVPGTITQGVAYALTQQVYVPASVLGGAATVDSIHVTGITGLPSGITYVINPASATFLGGSNGAICFSGTTSSAAGSYPATFTGTAYVKLGGVTPQTFQLNAAPANTILADTFTVQAAPPPTGCDTLFNLAGDTTTTYYTVGVTNDSGYISGNNFYGDLAKVEGFATTAGNVVNSAVIYPAVVNIATADTGALVTIGVWDNTGTAASGHAGAPGNMIDSVQVSLGEFAAALTSTYVNQQLVGLLVNFHGVASPGDTVYVGVVLPATTGDTLALFTNGVPGLQGDGWEEGIYQGQIYWETYNNDWGFGGNIGNLIIANICSSAASGYPAASFTSSPSSTVCSSSPVAFTDASVGTPAASLWNWSFGDGSSSSAKNPSHAYTTAGTYTVTESVSNNLGGAIQAFTVATSTITVNASPSVSVTVNDASSSSSSDGSVVVTTTGGSSPYSYAWSAGGSTTDSAGGLAHGTYTVTVTDANSCTTTASATVVVTGIITLNNAVTVQIYPNPATDVLNLVWSQKSNAEVSVLDLNGNIISTVLANGQLKTVCDIHNLAAGAYILRITDKSNNQQQSTLFSKF